MTGRKYLGLDIEHWEGIDRVTIANPPINLLDYALSESLLAYSDACARREDLRVIIFRSNDPDFFISHTDIRLFLKHNDPASIKSMRNMHQIIERFRTWNKITIGQISGRATGGGSEFLLALDMRFGAVGKTFVRQPEVSLGFIPSKGGVQMLVKLVGRARALEMIIGGQFYNSEQLERFGYLNAAVMAPVLNNYVKKIAQRIAAFSPIAVGTAKQAISLTDVEDFSEFETEFKLYQQVVSTSFCKDKLSNFLLQSNDTREGELSMTTK